LTKGTEVTTSPARYYTDAEWAIHSATIAEYEAIAIAQIEQAPDAAAMLELHAAYVRRIHKRSAAIA
jgi:hypothetical protein